MTPPVWERRRHEQDRTRGAAAGVKLMGMHACALPVAEPNVLRKQALRAMCPSANKHGSSTYTLIDDNIYIHKPRLITKNKATTVISLRHVHLHQNSAQSVASAIYRPAPPAQTKFGAPLYTKLGRATSFAALSSSTTYHRQPFTNHPSTARPPSRVVCQSAGHVLIT